MNADKLTFELNHLTHNLCLYYSLLVDDIYQRLMNKALAAGHQGLKLSHALILPQISIHGARIVDIAKSQGVSKQAIGQIANELEQLGYITRIDDIDDKRSKKLILTQQGIELITQAASFMHEVDNELELCIGAPNFLQLKKYSQQLFKDFALKYPSASTYTPEITHKSPLIAYATSLATHLDLLLQTQNMSKGHSPLKRSYWQILEKISHHGVRVNDLAELNGISKQAISQLANEIEKSGYIAREFDPSDKRAKKITLTPKGEQLIIDTINSTEYVENVVEDKIGRDAIISLKKCFQHYLSPTDSAKEIFQNSAETKIQKILYQFINHLNEDEKKQWTTKKGNKRKLSNEAIAHINTLWF
jgi:DNA-binding MarR family transcriptional regulator